MKQKLAQSKSKSPKKAQVDQLNDWNYCNPNNLEDELPQPYSISRFINKVLQHDILRNVYSKIFEIQKYSNDPNYEGHLKPLPPQGSFDISQTTCACKENSVQQAHNHVITGDASGNLMILDLNKKMRLARKEIGNQKRILKVVVSSRDLAQDEQAAIQKYMIDILTFLKNSIAVIAHLDATVYLYRYRVGENKLFLHHTFPTAKSEKTTKCTDIGEFPIDISISLYSQYLLVKQYNGNILVFKIPDFQPQTIYSYNKLLRGKQTIPPEEDKTKVQTTKTPQKTSTQPLQKNMQTIEQSQPKPTQPQSSLDIQSTQIAEIFYQVEFKGLKKEPKYQDIISKMKNDILLQQKEQEAQQAAKDDPKKKAAPPANAKDKKDTKITEADIQQQPIEEIEFNQTAITLKQEKSSEGIDTSELYPPRRFKQECFFITEPVNISLGQKQFNQTKSYDVIVGIVIAWTELNKFEIHKFQAPTKYNLPEYLQLKIQQLSEKTTTIEKDKSFSQQQPVLVSLPKAPQIKFENVVKTINLLYPISSLMVSQSSVFVAIGLKQGTIIIFDLSLNQEKFYLDKHQGVVSHLAFCDDWRLVSGASDGSVHIYDIQEEGKLVMKRTHQFRKGQSLLQDEQLEDKKQGKWAIVALGVSNQGVAVAIDGQQEVRLYDVWHGEKIGKLQAQQIMDDKTRVWTMWPVPQLYCFRRNYL